MILCTSPHEIGHCTECGKEFHSNELENGISKCPVCSSPLYVPGNISRLIPEAISPRIVIPA